MNKKGYTLVELLATIIVLAIIVGITIPVSLSVINNSKEKQRRILVENINTALKNYVFECNSNVGTVDCALSDRPPFKSIRLSKLVELGFLSYNKDNKIKDPVTGEDLSGCDVWIYSNNTHSFCGPIIDGQSNMCPDPSINICSILGVY